jgi:hypothetical protein
MSVHVGVFVFLGPSLPLPEARRILDATYLPPVAMGDIVRLLERRPTMIAIIDGLFEQTPAVWHKEILFALEQGVRVFGASSMGALRAAEMHRQGMQGVGAVFEAFRDGVLEDDDEVAVAHGPASVGFRSLSDAMVNLREGVRQARERGLISPATGDALIGLAKAMYYPERTWQAMFAAGRAAGLPEEEVAALEGLVAQTKPDLKRADAVRLLELLARGVPEGEPPDIDFEPTYHWELMRAEELLGEGLRALADEAQVPLSSAAIARHLRLRHGAEEAVRREALLHWLLSAEVARDPSLAEEGGESARADHRLANLDRRLAAVADNLLARRRAEIEAFIPLVLARRGHWPSAVKQLARTHQVVTGRGLERVSLEDAGTTELELVAWLAGKLGRPIPSLDEHAHREGFPSKEDLLEELLRYYLSER